MNKAFMFHILQYDFSPALHILLFFTLLTLFLYSFLLFLSILAILYFSTMVQNRFLLSIKVNILLHHWLGQSFSCINILFISIFQHHISRFSRFANFLNLLPFRFYHRTIFPLGSSFIFINFLLFRKLFYIQRFYDLRIS